MPRTDTAADTLARVEFNHPFTVTAVGTITDAPAGIYAPECYHDESTDITLAGAEDTWEALTGYTGQWSYSGAVMHASEYLGGRIASDILETPGVYVVVAVEVMPEDGDEDGDEEPAGWTVLRMRHANYPHDPGYLFDCPACDSSCHCTPGHAECVFEGAHNGSADE